MNRRKFLYSSGIALVATGGLGSSRRTLAQGTGLNTSVYNASAAAHAIAAGDYICATPTSSDWNVIGNTLKSVISDWTANSMDTVLQAAFSDVTPDQIASSNLNQEAILANLQVYQPTFTAPQLQNILSFLDAQSLSDKQSVLQSLQQSGLTPFLATLHLQSRNIADSLAGEGGGPSGASTSRATRRPHLLRSAYHAAGTGCSADAAAIEAATIALCVIGVMASGGVFLLAGWGAVAAWGGVATTAWSIGHTIACPF